MKNNKEFTAGNEMNEDSMIDVNDLENVTDDDEYQDGMVLDEGFDQGEDILGPDPETGEPRVEIVMDPLIAKAADASNFLKGILLRMGLSGRIAVTIRQGSIYLEIAGAEPGLIIGHRGQNLDALQHLVNRMVNRNSDDMIPVTVDSDEYRSRRNQQLENMVRSIGRDVLSSGEPSTTEPLTPSERRLFHIAASQIRGIKTESSGEGFFQPIRVSPVNAAPRYSQNHFSRYDNHSQARDHDHRSSYFPKGYYQDPDSFGNE